MDIKEVLMAIGTSVSIVFGALSVFAALYARKIAMGQAETALRASIRMTRQAVRDLAIKIGDVMEGVNPTKLSAEQRRRLEPLDKAFREAVEDNLNAYEDACAKYLDKKIDRARFKKMYIDEIRNLCQVREGVIHDFIHPEGASKFQAIWKVYREWHIHEK